MARARQTRAIDALIVHSPLVGPSTVLPCAAALAAHGWSVTSPDLRSSARSPETFCAAAERAVSSADIVVGHSGAGALLPRIAARVGARCAVFVDAVLPGETSVFSPSRGFLDLIDSLSMSHGLLPPWHRWWSTETVEELLPDETIRRVVVDEIPAIPRTFYDDAIDLPARWWTQPAAYLQLSPAYADDVHRAQRLGWPTATRNGRHLDMVVHPTEIADDIVDLVGRTVQVS